jgi:hypothetical protein
MKWRTKWVMLVKVNAILLASGFCEIIYIQYSRFFCGIVKQAKDEAIFKQLLKTVHPEF